MTEQDAIAVARRGVETFSAGDWNGYGDVLGPNGVYEEVASQRRATGSEENVALAKGWKTAFPDAKGTIDNAFASGDTVAMEITWRGTQTGPLEGPMGTIPATGKPVTVKAVQIVKVEGGKAKEVRHYFDLMGMMAQLGVVPAPART